MHTHRLSVIVQRVYVAAVLAVVAWGALSFGAVYGWAYTPLFVASGALGLLGLWYSAEDARPTKIGVLACALAGGALAISLQLIPLPRPALARLSPAADAFLLQYDLSYRAAASGLTHAADPGEASAVASEPAHPLSIQPAATRLTLLSVAAFGIFFLGLARAVSVAEACRLARGLVVLAVFLALIGIVQNATFSGRLYGFWQPQHLGQPFGPFVNRNHFAGWMVMALPVGIGYFCARVAHGMHGAGSDWRSRIVWFSSRRANQLILVALGILLMGLSLVLTQSRSGIASFALALLLQGWFIMKRQAGSKRVVALAYLVLLVFVSVGWAGGDTIARRFTATPDSALADRLTVWHDTARIIRDFPLVGTGLNTFGTAMLLYQSEPPAVRYTEAHNDYLQLAAEGGLLVGVPALVAVGFLAWVVRRRFREAESDQTSYWLRAGAVTGLVAIAFQEAVEFSLQMPGNAALFVVLAGIAMHRPAGPEAARVRL